jgi:hypothetical protein
MPVVLVDNALTDLDSVKSYLKIDPAITSDDDRLTGLINGCSTAIENYCRRTFATTTYTDEEYDGNQTQLLNLLHYPVQSVSSVSLNDVVLDPSQYKFKKRTGVLSRVGPYPNTFTGLSINRFQTVWNRGFSNILVTYTAGYDTIPDDLNLACQMYVAAVYRADIASFSTTFNDGMAFKSDAMPVQVKMMLQPYVDSSKGAN